MPIIIKEEVFQKFTKLGSNSSHFVWMLARLEFYQTAEGFIFGFQRRGSVFLFALEPLVPSGSPSFGDAWKEIVAILKPEVSVFISVYEPFFSQLKSLGFQGLSVGSEPWIRLGEGLAKGSKARGVRSAKNHAIKAGLVVNEWTAAEVRADSDKRKKLNEVYADWSGPQWIRLNGFTLATDPFSHSEIRRTFVLKSATQVEAYLIASPVPLTNSYYIEDLIIRRGAPNGSGEFITLEVLAALGAAGAYEASLGVVALSKYGVMHEPAELPTAVRFLLVIVPKWLKVFYNAEGQEIYRKRFQPHRWSPVYLGLQRGPGNLQSDFRIWSRAITALIFSFEPQLQLSCRSVCGPILRKLDKYLFTVVLTFINFAVFAFVNRFHDLPDEILMKYGFSSEAPLSEWLVRTIASEFLYLNEFHFYACASIMIFVMAWVERTKKRKFVAALLLWCLLLDDVVDYLFLHLPFQHLRPEVFRYIISMKDVGGSLILALFLGLQLNGLRRRREVILISLSFFLILGIALYSSHLTSLILNLNHVLFLFLGYLIGKLKFEFDRNESRRVSGAKTPVALSNID